MQMNRPKDLPKQNVTEPVTVKAGLLLRLSSEQPQAEKSGMEIPYCYYAAIRKLKEAKELNLVVEDESPAVVR